MGLSYNDLSLLRYIQKRQTIPLEKTARQFGKNEISIRRTIEQINLYSQTPLIEIKKGICYSRLNYSEFVAFIQHMDFADYASSFSERIRVMIVTIFFQSYVNASSLYQQWGLSLTTKKQDSAHLRAFLSGYGLSLITLKKKGLSIEGDELQLRFLVIDILHPLLEFTADNKLQARFANTPIEKQTFELALSRLEPAFFEAVEILNQFLDSSGLFLNYPSKKFLLLFICIMKMRPSDNRTHFSYRLPLAPLNIRISSSPQENRLYNVALSMMNFSHSLNFPYDARLWQITEQFAQEVVKRLSQPFSIREEFLNELYSYFYREITLNHFHCTFVDKTVENTKEQFKNLYLLIGQCGVYLRAAYDFSFLDEHISTLTLMVQKHIIRNRIIDNKKKRIIVMTSINFERVAFFLEQLREHIVFSWVETLNINEIYRLEELNYDYILCFSSRIYNILDSQYLPVIRVNFFVDDRTLAQLMECGFAAQKHRFLAEEFVTELTGMDEKEVVEYLKAKYGDYFI